MRLLVTGATGFIGSTLVLEAVKRGHQVIASGQLNTPAEQKQYEGLTARGLKVSTAALQEEGALDSLVQGCDGVIHLAAAQHEANVPDSYFRTVNVECTSNLLKASEDAGVRRFVYGSTIGVYGSARSSRLDEGTPPAPDNIYGSTKLEAEELVRRAHNDRFGTTIIRISETYGPGDMRLLKLFRAIQKGAFMMIGAGRNVRQVIHVRDLVDGLLLALEQPGAAGETFVLAGDEVLSTREMVSYIASALQRRPPRGRVPMFPFLIGAIAMETLLRPFGIQPPLHRRRLDFFRKDFSFSTDKARERLGFKPQVSFKDGVEETAQWYRRMGQL